jgi:iron complex outermembrane receptor protein
MKLIFTCLLLLAGLAGYSQQTIKGTVADAVTHEAIAGATVLLTDKVHHVQNSATTNADGRFVLRGEGAQLNVSMMGYTTVMLTDFSNPLSIQLIPSSLNLQPIVVSASREGQARQDAPVAISTISPTTIKDTRATQVYELLNKVAGVNTVNLSAEQHMMQIRQPITTRALYLYMEDGLPIRPVGIFNHNALYEINMAGVRDIEVIKGPASSLYGSNAVGGAVNFITQGPPSGYAGYVSLQEDSYHYRRADASGGFTSGKFGLYAGGYLAKQDHGWQDYSDFNKSSGSIKTTYTFDTNTHLTAKASYNYLYTQTPGSLDSAHFYSQGYSSNQKFAYRKVEAFRADARLDRAWNDKNFSFLTLFYRNNSTAQLPSYYISDARSSNGQYLNSTGQVNDQSFHSFGLLAQHRTNFSFLNSRLIAGVYVDDSPSSYYAKFLSIQKNVAASYYTGYTNTDSLIDNYRIKLLNTAAYLQYELQPTSALRIVTGLRYDRVFYDFSNNLPANRTKYKQQQTNSFNVLAPKAGFTYNLTNNNGFYGNFSVGFQPPETGDLYSSRQLKQVGQATFYNYELGGWVSLLNKKLYFEVSLYDMEGRNEIVSILQPDNTSQNENAGATRHKGIEYTLTYTPVKSLLLRLSGTNAEHTYLTYSSTQTIGGKNTTIFYNGNRMVNAPAWIANAEATYKPLFLPGLRAALEWQHIGKYYKDNANTKTYNGYNIFNLRTGYEFRGTAVKGLGIWVNVLNLTNRLYATNVTSSTYSDTYYAAPPRITTIGISYSFAKN